ncbi:hypothetical protein [Bradyrhizobium sp. STM 3843]|uniref:hypothetical protein n=1 Tax=Bradyrhizobium sp. STM 3843 TaxID=551947 RepID=UPI0011128411|nr:hypothetical protein [Bradyrhizobium sp. STM 3843]
MTAVLQTLGPDHNYRPSEISGAGPSQQLELSYYLDIFKRRFFYFLIPFGLVSVLGLIAITFVRPNYLSEGKILVESSGIAADFVKPVISGNGNERVQLIQQRVITRDNLLLVAKKYGLFQDQSGIADLMRQHLIIKPADIEGQARQNTPITAFTVAFEYDDPEIAMKVANEFVTLIISEDERSRTSRATEMVKLLTEETKDIQDKLSSTQAQIVEASRRPREAVPEISEQQKTQAAALSALKLELAQKVSIYSDAHPAVVSLKKRIAAMEKVASQPLPASAVETQAADDDIEGLKRQRDTLEKRLAEANGKLSNARLSEKLDQQEHSERLQLIEAPSLPQKPVKSNRLKLVGLAFAAAAALGVGFAIGTELLSGTIRTRGQLSAVISGPLIVCIPYLRTPWDVFRSRLRFAVGLLSILVLLTAWAGLVAAIAFNMPIDISWLEKARSALFLLSATGQG